LISAMANGLIVERGYGNGVDTGMKPIFMLIRHKELIAHI